MHVRIKESTPPSPARIASRGGEATARAAASGSTPMGSAAQRMNAGPHAASLAGLQAVVAQRACAGCEHVRRAMGGADPAQRAAKDRGALPDGLRAGLESLSGRDLSGVSVHYDSPKPAQLNAHAYAQGSEIHLAPGQERHLPHEGWHAVQQMQSRVRPTTSVGGTPVNDSARLEREADVMGARAMSAGGAAQRASRAGTSGAGTATGVAQQVVVQRLEFDTEAEALAALRQVLGADMDEGKRFQLAKQYLDYAVKQRWDDLEDVAIEYVRSEEDADTAAEFDAPGAYKRYQSIREMRHFEIPFEKSNQFDLSGWSSGYPDLAGSHHKFPKRTFGWLVSRMTQEQREKLNARLYLPREAGPSALARLRSNLIPWGPDEVASDTRLDDPEHTREWVDMVKTESGLLTPRSRAYSDLAFSYDAIRTRLERLRESTMSDEEADRVGSHLREAEEWHHAIEADSTLPADYGEDFWTEDSEATEARKWTKGRVPDSKYAGKTPDIRAYEEQKAREERARRAEAARRTEVSRLGYTPVRSLSGMEQLMRGDHWKH